MDKSTEGAFGSKKLQDLPSFNIFTQLNFFNELTCKTEYSLKIPLKIQFFSKISVVTPRGNYNNIYSNI